MAGGTSLSRRIQVRRADVSKWPGCASEEEKAPSSSGAAWPGTSGRGARGEFSGLPPAHGLTILLVDEPRFLGEGEQRKRGKKRYVKAAEMTLSEI